MTGPIRQEPRPALPRLRPGYRFRPKRFGLGAVPASWQGWLLTLAVLVCAILVGRVADQRGPIWLALLVPLLVGFLVLARIKTDGEWRWRWGSGD